MRKDNSLLTRLTSLSVMISVMSCRSCNRAVTSPVGDCSCRRSDETKNDMRNDGKTPRKFVILVYSDTRL